MAAAARCSRLAGRLLLASRTNPKPLCSSSSSAPPATARVREEHSLSRPPSRDGPGSAATSRSRSSAVPSRSLRHEHRYEHALEIFSWMDSCNSLELSSWDHAARLDLIAKAHGTSQAEEYYKKLRSAAAKTAASFPLLHCYVTERDVQKAETFMAELQSCGQCIAVISV